MAAYNVVQFSPAALTTLIVESSHDLNKKVGAKNHLTYLSGYLGRIGAKTIVVEQDYTDRDFLEDFAAYYVRCFTQYKRQCVRLHFFSSVFNRDDFSRCLTRVDPSNTLDPESYLGFIVVKPLPTTVIGRSCLATYKSDTTRAREYPIECTISVNLFGINLKIRSVPFQEQDTDVAACASSALWSVFHGTGRLFQHAIPSPVEITKSASLHARIDDRTLPNRNGLTAFQIADAIRSVGLEPFAVRGSDTAMLRLAATAYLRAGIPCVLLSEIRDPNKNNASLGRHAVAVVGYSFGNSPPQPFEATQTLLRASTVDRLYCHDDQTGPYAALEFEDGGEIIEKWAADGKMSRIGVKPENFLVPLYHKIRLPFATVMDTVVQLDRNLEALREADLLPINSRLVWDIYLNEVSKLRNDIFLSDRLPSEMRASYLTKSYPRYIWCAECYADGQPQFRLMYDATDLLQGQHFVDCVPFNMDLCRAIAVVMVEAPEIAAISPVFAWFGKNISPLN